MIGIRGAIAEVSNTSEDIISSTKELFIKILETNSLEVNKIISVLFTTTHDLTDAFPAKAIRELGYTSISAIDTLAPNVKNDLKGCIRVLVHYNDEITFQHVYLGEAKNLRPDR
ncbi:chorismate mutase [Acidimicrobiia bacterium]|jgi:chorismate mutase|nr:chorismate mutase [Acidimicrobiia bacterium]MDA9275849.1 chorismate mutase [Acidimicrobiia bacterium]MDC1071366.1 chorismate mutase [Acidimicrobiia bacterium]